MSYVAMETLQCPICGDIHSHNAGILIHKRLRNIPKDQTLTGHGLCEEHDKLFKEGYIAMIVVSNPSGEKLTLKEAVRTGDLIHIKKELASRMFENFPENLPFVFIEKELFELLQKMEANI